MAGVDPRSRSGDGFTIIEVVVASTVLIGALLAAAAMFSNAILASGNTRNRVVAANLASSVWSPTMTSPSSTRVPDLSAPVLLLNVPYDTRLKYLSPPHFPEPDTVGVEQTFVRGVQTQPGPVAHSIIVGQSKGTG
jgi:hypothetical protein